jgi:lipid II:glycine glycyltransferase (peptidoglycan interpeptide bridge formation enzyme)
MVATTRIFHGPQDRMAWDERIAAAPGGHLLQSWAWGELKARFGWRAQRVAAGSACAQILYHPLPGGLGTVAYIPKGPLLDPAGPSGRPPALAALLDAIRPLARRQRAICLKIEPNLEEGAPDAVALIEQLRALGFRPSAQTVQPRRTILVDLDGEPEALLKRMKQKTRYNVRLAGRKGVTVRPGDEADLPHFYALMEQTAQRDDFGIHTQAYYEAAHRLFVPSGQGQLLLAEYEGQLLAGLVVMALGHTACYMYGASSVQHRRRMPAYPLQWQAMLWAKERGCRTYDLWGVPDEDEATLEKEFTQRGDGLWGVYRFKRGFGGRLARTGGAWDLVYAPLRYRLYTLAVNWRASRSAPGREGGG